MTKVKLRNANGKNEGFVFKTVIRKGNEFCCGFRNSDFMGTINTSNQIQKRTMS